MWTLWFQQGLYGEQILSFIMGQSDTEPDQILLFHIPARKPDYHPAESVINVGAASFCTTTNDAGTKKIKVGFDSSAPATCWVLTVVLN